MDHYFDAVRGHKTLILDLRGNPGGLSLTLDRMLANVFDHDVKIADRIGRKDSKPEVAKAVHHPFTGRLIVLVDSSSASAAELFARVIQLEHRGTVIGDRSSGHVMESGIYPCKLGLDTELWYAFSVTAADLIMKDGNSLEHVGVKPDESFCRRRRTFPRGRIPFLLTLPSSRACRSIPTPQGRCSRSSGCPSKRKTLFRAGLRQKATAQPEKWVLVPKLPVIRLIRH